MGISLIISVFYKVFIIFNLISFNANKAEIELENKVRDTKIKEWDNIAKKQPKLVNYLKDNIHGENDR